MPLIIFFIGCLNLLLADLNLDINKDNSDNKDSCSEINSLFSLSFRKIRKAINAVLKQTHHVSADRLLSLILAITWISMLR